MTTTRSLTRSLPVLLISLPGLLSGCAGEIDVGESQSIARIEEGLTGCQGHASSSVPSSGNYILTSFGSSPSDDGQMSCGSFTKHGSWYYAASRQRYGCGSRIKIEANGKCVVAQTDDYGPDVCVENAAGMPIIDASPLVAEHLFGVGSAGWSDHFRIHVTEVSKSTALGPCKSDPQPPPPKPAPKSCYSGTLAKTVAEDTCVQSVSDGAWYKCVSGSWQAGHSNCGASYGYCHSSTLNKYVAARTCVESRSDKQWYQCGASEAWLQPVKDGAGPVGTCSVMHSL